MTNAEKKLELISSSERAVIRRKNQEMAKKLKEKGIDKKIIIELTGLTEEQIKKL